jgi:hypothetical protein
MESQGGLGALFLSSGGRYAETMLLRRPMLLFFFSYCGVGLALHFAFNIYIVGECLLPISLRKR